MFGAGRLYSRMTFALTSGEARADLARKLSMCCGEVGTTGYGAGCRTGWTLVERFDIEPFSDFSAK